MSSKMILGIVILFIIIMVGRFLSNNSYRSKTIEKILSNKGDIAKKSEVRDSCQRPNGCLCRFITILEVLANIVTILGIGTILNLPSIKKAQPIQSIAAKEWEKEFECLKIKASSSYIEKEIGLPISTNDYIYSGVNMTTSVYLNKYFTLLCYYADESLFGYLIISNNKHFTPSNYRSGFELLNYTMSETADYCLSIYIAPFTFCSCSNNPRLSCNRYFLQFGFQHARGGGDNVYIGYGFTDIGMSNSHDIYDQIFDNSPTIKALIDKESDDCRQLDWTSDPIIADFPINMFLIFDESNKQGIDVEKFINEQVALNGLYVGISKDEFANLQPDYMKAIERMGY